MWIAKKKTSTKGRKVRQSKSKAKAVVSIVKSVLNRELETKYVADRQTATFNSGISVYTEAYSMLPPLSTNAALAGQTFARVGSQITPLTVKLDIMLAIPAIQRTVAVKYDLYILTRKQNKFMPAIVALGTQIPQLLMSGNPALAPTIPYDGLMVNSFLRLNTNEFTILHHKQGVLLQNVGIANGDIQLGNAPNVSAAAACHRYSLRLTPPAVLKYDETSPSFALYPNNYAPFMFVGYSKLDGSSADVVNQSVLASWTTSMTFKDS